MTFALALLPALAGLGLLLSGLRGRGTLAAAAAAALLATLTLVGLAVSGGWASRLPWAGPLVLTAALPPVSAAMAALVPLVALPVVLWAAAREEAEGLRRLLALLLVFVGAMELVAVAADLLTLLIGWELVGACSWALIAHDWRAQAPSRSALYAFVMTRGGDLGLFAAAAAAYAGAGSFAYADLAAMPEEPLAVVVAGVLLAAAAKSGQLPFSPWLFRAMDGPTAASALLHSATMAAAGAFLVIRLQPELSGAPGFGAAAMALGLATALAGGVVALVQPHAKKLLAASTSAHCGLMFAAAGAGYPAVAFLHLAAHAAFKSLLFLAAGSAGHLRRTYRLSALRAGRALPVIAGASAVAALSLAGLPPLAGGWTKEGIAAAVSDQASWAGAAVMLAGGLSAAYAARFQLLAFRRGEDAAAAGAMERAGPLVLALATLALSLLWLPAAQEAASRLLGGELAHPSTTEMAVSLLLVALGLAGGAWLAHRLPALGETGRAAAAADWLGLPTLWDRAAIRPVGALAATAARWDDAVLDAPARLLARVGEGGEGTLSGFAAEADRSILDRPAEATGAGARRWADAAASPAEAALDRLPEGLARLALRAGARARRLQSGMAHHYYALLAIGAAGAILILLLGT